jgi:hypothetical protein
MRRLALALAVWAFACETETIRWKLEEPLADPSFEREIFRALDAASETGTYPPLSKFQVRTATVVDGQAVLDGNTTFEEALPHAFSAASFMPGRLEEFLEQKR